VTHRKIEIFKHMKSFRSILAVLIATFVAGRAVAQVEINLSGAVAFRDTAYFAIRGLFGGELISQNPADGPTASTQLKINWTGRLTNLFGNQTVTVRAFYNGAVAGVQDLTQNRDVAFLASTNPGTTNLVGAGFKSDIAFSSVFQQSTEFLTPTLEDVRFGATPIVLLKSSSAPASLTNITTHQFKTLAANGALPAWFFTGNTNDTQTIYFINRDPTAGQRVTLFKESLFTGAPISYFWNANTANYVIDPTGRNATQIRDTLNQFGPAISYLVTADAIGVNGGANVLRYNGALPFANATFNATANDYRPLYNGQYSLWVYEHLLNRATASQNVRTFRNALVAAIEHQLETSPNSVPLSRLNVERTADGAPVAPIE
jgi:hypothetical protein